MFENRVLGTMFGPEREDVTGGWRKSSSEKLHILYSSQKCHWCYLIRKGEMGGACRM
jgi:hypothetical protein